jgi:nitrate/nitrite-specific signal transduction histidine kinase
MQTNKEIADVLLNVIQELEEHTENLKEVNFRKLHLYQIEREVDRSYANITHTIRVVKHYAEVLHNGNFVITIMETEDE